MSLVRVSPWKLRSPLQPGEGVDAQPYEPAKHQIVVDLLHQLPLGAHRVERNEARSSRSGAIDWRPVPS